MRVGASQNHSLSASLQALTCLHCPQAVCLSAQAIDECPGDVRTARHFLNKYSFSMPCES